MMGKFSSMLLASALAALLAGPAAAAEPMAFESCDSRGNSVPALPDSRLTVLVSTIGEPGRQEIRYNPDILPRLSSNARFFFYAHQCARLDPNGAAGSARRADCHALNTLLDGNRLKYGDLPALQAELKFSDEEWSLLPGPARQIDLSNCRASSGDVLRLPLSRQASPQQNAWNTCVRTCADRLLSCRNSSRDGARNTCQTDYDRCRSSCQD